MSYWTSRSIALRVKQLTETIPDILARIVARKREELLRLHGSHAELESQAELRLRADPNDLRSFAAALRAKHPAIIAEIKKASPSKGLLSHDFQPAMTAQLYQQIGQLKVEVDWLKKKSDQLRLR